MKSTRVISLLFLIIISLSYAKCACEEPNCRDRKNAWKVFPRDLYSFWKCVYGNAHVTYCASGTMYFKNGCNHAYYFSRKNLLHECQIEEETPKVNEIVEEPMILQGNKESVQILSASSTTTEKVIEITTEVPQVVLEEEPMIFMQRPMSQTAEVEQGESETVEQIPVEPTTTEKTHGGEQVEAQSNVDTSNVVQEEEKLEQNQELLAEFSETEPESVGLEVTTEKIPVEPTTSTEKNHEDEQVEPQFNIQTMNVVSEEEKPEEILEPVPELPESEPESNEPTVTTEKVPIEPTTTEKTHENDQNSVQSENGASKTEDNQEVLPEFPENESDEPTVTTESVPTEPTTTEKSHDVGQNSSQSDNEALNDVQEEEKPAENKELKAEFPETDQESVESEVTTEKVPAEPTTTEETHDDEQNMHESSNLEQEPTIEHLEVTTIEEVTGLPVTEPTEEPTTAETTTFTILLRSDLPPYECDSDMVCLPSYEGMLLPNRNDTTKYCQCLNNECVPEQCPDEFVFNYRNQVCSKITDSPCIQNTDNQDLESTSRIKLGSSLPVNDGSHLNSDQMNIYHNLPPYACDYDMICTEMVEGALLPNRNDTTKYCECLNSECVPKQCPEGFHFHYKTQICSRISDSPCENNERKRSQLGSSQKSEKQSENAVKKSEYADKEIKEIVLTSGAQNQSQLCETHYTIKVTSNCTSCSSSKSPTVNMQITHST